MRTRPKFAATVLVAVFCFLVQPCQAQILADLPAALQSDQYVKMFDQMLINWNRKALALPPKSDLRARFVARLNQSVSSRTYGYETDAWRQQMTQIFDKLPEKVVPQQQISEAAGAVLKVLFLKCLAEVKQNASVERVKQELALSLYLILATAQTSAKVVDCDVILDSLAKWWGTTWPFSDGKVPPVPANVGK